MPNDVQSADSVRDVVRDGERLRHWVHSGDFDRMGSLLGEPDKINGKALEEWNDEHGLTGILEALKGMGWDSWQWRWTHPDRVSQKLKDLGGHGCFMEVFGHNYGGYIRTDSATLNGCGVKALNIAQRYAKCEIETGHNFDKFRDYKNGCIACTHCGFGGYTPIWEHMRRERDTWKMHAEMQKEQVVKLHAAIIAAGFKVTGMLGERELKLEARPNEQ
jgi:hypothetical protein